MENIQHTTEEIKDNFDRNLGLVHSIGLEQPEEKAAIEKAQLNFIKERFCEKYNYTKEELDILLKHK